MFRNETEKVERLVKKSNSNSPASGGVSDCGGSTPARNESTSPVVSNSGSAGECVLDVQEPPSPLALRRVEDSTWEERAICYFFDQYTTFGDTGDCVNHLQFLPSLYALCRENEREGLPSSCLRWAVDATSLITLGNEAKIPSLAVKARQSYGMALRGLRQALESRSQAVQDETFAAIVLLSLFEDITGERNGLSSSHTAGFELLMKLRGESQLGHQLGRDLFSFAYAQTVWMFLVGSSREADWLAH